MDKYVTVSLSCHISSLEHLGRNGLLASAREGQNYVGGIFDYERRPNMPSQIVSRIRDIVVTATSVDVALGRFEREQPRDSAQGSNSRGSLRIVSGLAENTNSIICDGSSEPETANGCPVLQGCRDHQPRGTHAQ